MTKIKSVKATGEWVVLEAREVEAKEQKTNSGLIVPGKQANGQAMNTSKGKKTVDLFIYDIGPGVPADKINYKVGDCVIIDNYDMQCIDSGDDKTYVICHYAKIKCIIKIEDF